MTVPADTGVTTESPPVVLLVFNRPDLTALVFDVIRRVQPRQLLLVADGPRPGRPDDESLCSATRDVIADVDWPCEVLRSYADRNLGCGPAVSAGIEWAFGHVD